MHKHPKDARGGNRGPGARRRDLRGSRTGRVARIQSPRSPADRGRSADRQHGCLRVREPGQAQHGQLRQLLDPLRGAGGRPELLLLAEHTNYDINIDNNGDARPDIIYRWTFTTHYRQRRLFIYNTGPVTSLNDANLIIYQTYDLYRIKNGNSVVLLTTRQSRRATWVPARCRTTTPICSTRRSRHRGGIRSAGSDSPTTPSSWICGSSTCCTAATSARPATTPWTGSTSTRWRCRSQGAAARPERRVIGSGTRRHVRACACSTRRYANLHR